VEIYHHTLLFQTQWLGKRQNGTTKRLSKVTVEQEERMNERKKGRKPKAKPQGDEWMK
jgi:hypothetical protein